MPRRSPSGGRTTPRRSGQGKPPCRRSRTRSRKKKTQPSRRTRWWVGVAVVVALAAGIVLGMKLAEPPSVPDLSALAPVAPDETAAATTASKAALEPKAVQPSEANPPKRSPAAAAVPAHQAADPAVPASSEAVSETHPGSTSPAARQPPPGGPVRIALVIDDLGRSLTDLDRLAGLGIPLTYAVLPFESRTPQVVQTLRDRGAEVLCHLPMEPTNGADPGPGALRSTMTGAELRAATLRALDAVPGAVGVNNHMGSGVTSRRDAMAVVLGLVAERGLYYLDSRTTSETVGYAVARELDVPAAERQVFLDDDRRPERLAEEWRRLLDLAHRRGGAIGIAHPHPETLELLAREIPSALEAGVEFVVARDLVDSG